MRKVLLLWFVSLIVVAGSTYVWAQQQNRLPAPRVLSGGDIGFRVEGTDINGKPTGTLVVRWNGAWVEPGMSVRPVPAK
jgi:hypothetical protein